MSFVICRTNGVVVNNEHESPSSVRLTRGDVFPEDHWVVLSRPVADFEPIRLDSRTADAVAEQFQARAQLGELVARHGGVPSHWDDAVRERASAYRQKEGAAAEQIRAGLQARDTLMRNATRGDGFGETFDPNPPSRGSDRQPDSRGLYSQGPAGTSGSELRGRALDLVEQSERSAPWLTRSNLQAAAAVIEADDGDGLDMGARWALAVGTDAYRSAFTKLLRGRQHEWTPQESAAITKGREVERAMGLGATSAGAMVPMQLDPAIILTSGGSTNPFRQVARQVISTGNVWTGVSSLGVTAEWIGESVQVADASPTLASPTITNWKYDAFVPYSVEAEGDAVNLYSELSRVMNDGVDQLQSVAFATGSGTAQPWGIVSALIGGSSIVTGTTLISAEVIATQNALPPRFSANAKWLCSLPIINQMMLMETAAGARLFPGLIENPRVLLGKPLLEASTMDNTIAAGATPDYVLLYGDFSNYVITDRVGTQVEVVQQMMGANNRPLLQRGLILWGRCGADSVNDNAFRLLNAAS
jgi:HK97 family phage major capsid protein